MTDFFEDLAKRIIKRHTNLVGENKLEILIKCLKTSLSYFPACPLNNGLTCNEYTHPVTMRKGPCVRCYTFGPAPEDYRDCPRVRSYNRMLHYLRACEHLSFHLTSKKTKTVEEKELIDIFYDVLK